MAPRFDPNAAGDRLRAIKYRFTGTPEIRLLDFLCDRKRTSIDVGANIGQFTHWMMRYSAAVVCFEPLPENAARLRVAFPKAEVREGAASNATGVAELIVPSGSGGERTAAASLEQEFTTGRPVSVPTERIDDVVNGPVGFIKIDVEGHELAVIEGAAQTLADHRPNLLVEIEQRHQKRPVHEVVEDLCETHRYASYFLGNGHLQPFSAFRMEFQDLDRVGDPAAYINNFLFLPR